MQRSPQWESTVRNLCESPRWAFFKGEPSFSSFGAHCTLMINASATTWDQILEPTVVVWQVHLEKINRAAMTDKLPMSQLWLCNSTICSENLITAIIDHCRHRISQKSLRTLFSNSGCWTLHFTDFYFSVFLQLRSFAFPLLSFDYYHIYDNASLCLLLRIMYLLHFLYCLLLLYSLWRTINHHKWLSN